MLITAESVFARSSYVSRIPNGSVYSCATCHDDSMDLNGFGNAFSGTWDASLATRDSDGDGFSNGTELGDPNGTGTPTPSAQVTNPGDPASKPAATAPAITTQPAGRTVTEGATVTFSVVASGTAPLSYQWLKNGANIAGATSASLTLTAVTTASAGTYSVRVSNTAGSATSAGATLTVNSTPARPTVAIASPVDGATYTAPANVQIQVAAQSGLAISKVELFVGTNLLTILSQAP